MPSPTDPSNPPQHGVDLDVRGALPAGLSGRLVGIGRDGVVHSVQVHDGRASYCVRRFRTDAVLHNLVVFGGSILAFGDDSPAYELSAALDTLSPVDLAGKGRPVAPFPKFDPTTGELHVLACTVGGTQAHVVVSAGALTRRSRPILDTPNRIEDIALTDDRVVFLADGFVGVASRGREPRTVWIATGIAAPSAVHAHDARDAVVLLALTPLLERWTLHPGDASIQREVLDPTPRRFAHGCTTGDNGAPRLLWTTGNGTIGHHVLDAPLNVHYSLRPNLPGDLVFVADAARDSDAGGGWIVGFVHDTAGEATELRIFDAADIVGPAVVPLPIPRPVPRELRCTWIPSTRQ